MARSWPGPAPGQSTGRISIAPNILMKSLDGLAGAISSIPRNAQIVFSANQCLGGNLFIGARNAFTLILYVHLVASSGTACFPYIVSMYVGETFVSTLADFFASIRSGQGLILSTFPSSLWVSKCNSTTAACPVKTPFLATQRCLCSIQTGSTTLPSNIAAVTAPYRTTSSCYDGAYIQHPKSTSRPALRLNF